MSCFSALIPSLVSGINPILGATLITCKSATIPSAGIFASRRITLADFLPMPFNATKPSIVSGIFSSFWMVCAISKSQFALVPKFRTLEMYGNNASTLETVRLSILG